MAQQSKYIIVESMGLEMPVVFNPCLKHSDFATVNGKIVSAGFCYQKDDGAYSVYGESNSLKLKSRPEDKELIEKYLEFDI